MMAGEWGGWDLSGHHTPIINYKYDAGVNKYPDASLFVLAW
jgi:hypothetical protein